MTPDLSKSNNLPMHSEMKPENLTRSELGAMLEILLHRSDWSMRRMLQERMPAAYQRLHGFPANDVHSGEVPIESRVFPGTRCEPTAEPPIMPDPAKLPEFELCLRCNTPTLNTLGDAPYYHPWCRPGATSEVSGNLEPCMVRDRSTIHRFESGPCCKGCRGK